MLGGLINTADVLLLLTLKSNCAQRRVFIKLTLRSLGRSSTASLRSVLKSAMAEVCYSYWFFVLMGTSFPSVNREVFQDMSRQLS